MRFRMCCNLKTAPYLSGRSPSFQQSAHYLNGMSRCSRWPVGDRGPPRPLGPMHSVTLSPPTSDAPARVNCIHRFHVMSLCFLAAIFVSESQLRVLSVYGHSSHNYQRKVNETLPEGSQGFNMPGICCAVTTVVRKTPNYNFIRSQRG